MLYCRWLKYGIIHSLTSVGAPVKFHRARGTRLCSVQLHSCCWYITLANMGSANSVNLYVWLLYVVCVVPRVAALLAQEWKGDVVQVQPAKQPSDSNVVMTAS